MTMPSCFRVSATPTVACLTVLLTFSGLSFAEKGKPGRDEVEKKLEAKYKLSTFTPGRGTIQAGSFLLIQKNGLEMTAATAGFSLPTAVLSFKDGRLSKTTKTIMLLKDRLVPFPNGTALIVTKIEANDNNVAFEVVTADALEGTYYKASIHFDFGKGYLEPPDMNRIESAVASLFNIEKQEGQAGGQQQQQQPQQQGGRGGPPPQQAPQQQQQQQQQTYSPPPPPPEPPPAPPEPPAPPPAPVEIKMGMTGDQVKAALGKPTSSTKFGTKEIYVYPSMKVTLVNGKVTNVE
jgi:hypothetical protein